LDREIAAHYSARQQAGDVDDYWEDDGPGFIYVFDVRIGEVEAWPELRHTFKIAFRDTPDGWFEVELPTED
jgi:hypothetical protein